MVKELSLENKKIHFITHPAERLIERGLSVKEVKRIICNGYTVPDLKCKYPNTKIAIGKTRGKYWSIPYTEHPKDLFVITARPSRQDEINIYKKKVRKRWK